MAKKRATRAPPPSNWRRRPRQDRSRQTVDALLTAAAEIFDAHGYDGATTERIAARAGVSIGSLYQYFAGKEALLDAVGQRLLDEIELSHADMVAALETGPDLEGGVRVFVDWLVAAHAGHRRLRCLFFEHRLPELRQIERVHGETVAALESWLAGRVARPHASARLLHRGIATLVHQFVLHPVGDLPPDEAVAEIRRMALAYLRDAAT